MRKYEFYPDCRDQFEYYGSKEIERIRIKAGRPIRRDWLIFNSVEEAIIYFKERCGVIEGRYV